MRFFPRSKTTGKTKNWRKWLIVGAGAGLGIFVLANGAMWLVYRERVLPNYSVGSVAVGNVSFGELPERLTAERLLPEHLELTKGEEKQSVTTAELGLKVDVAESTKQLKAERTFLPLLTLMRQRTVPVSLHIDDEVYAAAADKLKKSFQKAAKQQHITFAKDNFEIVKATNGYALDSASLKTALVRSAEQGSGSVAVPTIAVKPKKGRDDLAAELKRLRQQLDVAVTFKHSDQTFRPDRADKGKWYVRKGQTMALSDEKIRAYVQGLAADIYNVGDAASAAMYALDNRRATTLVLSTEPAAIRYAYCTAVRGVSSSHLSGFAAKVAATLADPRGWSANGRVVFSRVDSGCDFTIWLSHPSKMTSFGGLCDPYWSCRSGNNVVINFDRWQGATDAWNNAGGSLEDYRVMVTNHEVGHRLGFGHSNCSGPGKPAPVMQQQSMNLQGCKFNPWPLPSELDALAS